MMQLNIKARTPESRGRPPTGSMKPDAMFTLARDGTHWWLRHYAAKRADDVWWIAGINQLPEVQKSLQEEVVNCFIPWSACTIRLHEIEGSWILGAGFRFYCSGFKDPPERKGLGYYVRVENPPNMEFQSVGFAYCMKGKLIKPCRRKFISGFWSQRFRSARDWVNITCTGECLWKPDRDNYTSSITALNHTVWPMDYTAGLMTLKDSGSPGDLVGKHRNSKCSACLKRLDMQNNWNDKIWTLE
jgi:hypothetical protein